MSIRLSDDDLLLVIDVQNDFCDGGALAVADGDAVVPVINRLTERFGHVALTQDWHPSGHSSFATSHPGSAAFETIRMPYGEQTLWPDHCVQGTTGAAFHRQLATERAELVIRKGFRPEIDSYSAFHENDRRTPTGLAGYLRERGLQRIFLAGLATDYCVYYSAMDARRLGFDTVIIEAGCRAIDLAGSLGAAWAAMAAAGVQRVNDLG
jgi:nicotinamidase/pyrazinamidase